MGVWFSLDGIGSSYFREVFLCGQKIHFESQHFRSKDEVVNHLLYSASCQQREVIFKEVTTGI